MVKLCCSNKQIIFIKVLEKMNYVVRKLEINDIKELSKIMKKAFLSEPWIEDWNEQSCFERLNILCSIPTSFSFTLVNENNVTIITGGPGTGKTTIIKTIIDIYEQRKDKVVLCAPTRTSCKKNDRNNRKRSLNIT